jgi:hypothetical protein
MGALLLSGETSYLKDWDPLDVIGLTKTKEEQLILLQSKEMDNKIGPYCSGLTYYEIEQLDRFNDKRFR